MKPDLPNREELFKAVMLGLVAREELTEPELEVLFPTSAEDPAELLDRQSTSRRTKKATN